MDLFFFVLWIFGGFAIMEIASYLLHRFLFHGFLWRIHRTHHESHTARFELNDLFSIGFALIAVYLIVSGIDEQWPKATAGIGIGITIYGILYFIIHDLFTHRRFLPFSSENKLLGMIRRAHQRHHQTTKKDGFEPYGLFLFPYSTFRSPFKRKRTSPSEKSGK